VAHQPRHATAAAGGRGGAGGERPRRRRLSSLRTQTGDKAQTPQPQSSPSLTGVDVTQARGPRPGDGDTQGCHRPPPPTR